MTSISQMRQIGGRVRFLQSGLADFAGEGGDLARDGGEDHDGRKGAEGIANGREMELAAPGDDCDLNQFGRRDDAHTGGDDEIRPAPVSPPPEIGNVPDVQFVQFRIIGGCRIIREARIEGWLIFWSDGQNLLGASGALDEAFGGDGRKSFAAGRAMKFGGFAVFAGRLGHARGLIVRFPETGYK